MTRYSKLLAIFVALASLAFVGFAVATTFGGPDWAAVMQAPEFDGYRISRTDEPQVLYTATRARDEQQLASSRRLPEVIAKILDDIAQQQQTEIQQLNERQAALNNRVAQLTKGVADDQIALEQSVEQQRERLSTLRQEEAVVAAQVLLATAEAQKLQKIIASRREDIFRLRQQAAELKIDEFRLMEIEQQLNNLLIQTQGNAQRAEDREASLKRQLGE